MLSEEESQELLAISTSNVLLLSISGTNSWEKLNAVASEQQNKTDTILKKVILFIKTQFLRQPNRFEEFVLSSESNDCSLVAKYAKVSRIDLSKQSAISVDSVHLQTLHIPHPLINFMKNEANQPDVGSNESILSELTESPVLLFVHGLGGQMSQFEPLMGLLSQSSEIFSLDLPGFGNSKVDFENAGKFVTPLSQNEQHEISNSISKLSWNDFATENIVNIIYEFIQQNIPPEKKLILIGHSMGTILLTKLAKKLPKSKVEGLILLSPPPLVDDISQPEQKPKSKLLGLLSMLKFFSFFPFIFNMFRVWDRLQALESKSVLRQLTPNSNIYNRLRQFRWNIDINSGIVLKYVNGFQKATYSDLISAISKFNDNPQDKTTYEKTLIIGGANDSVTPIKTISEIGDSLTNFFQRKVSASIKVNNAGHSLLLNKPEFISGIILNHLEANFPERLHLSPAWVLKVKASISGDKWGLKNELKWLQLKPLSFNITRNYGKDVSPLLGMKTLREGDSHHSPVVLENQFYDENVINTIRGKLIAIVDISADIPPYSPKSFTKIKYYKCATVSKVVPDQVAVRRFIQLIDDILGSNTEELPLIAVHCHYGFNRTGFLICCYLIEKLGWSVQDAVEGFKNAKPPGIKHPHFIDALYVRYDSS